MSLEQQRNLIEFPFEFREINRLFLSLSLVLVPGHEMWFYFEVWSWRIALRLCLTEVW
jgi:hypothetical protein